MGSSSSGSCTTPTNTKEDIRLPFAVAQADKFDSEDCPFCAYRRGHVKWLRDEIKRLTSEVASLETTIPPKFLPELHSRLEDDPLPESAYTGGVEDIRGTGCTRCSEVRREVKHLQRDARMLDSQCKARIEFHQSFARRIEALLIEKRRIEAQLFFRQRGENSSRQGGDSALDGHFCAITKVNQPDDVSDLLPQNLTLPARLKSDPADDDSTAKDALPKSVIQTF
mmetsp:Transcript_106329/g.174564  ORF Transcript_106329/g.174564 Transcript_106329/m.174564 type:complete len:225 (+) Transcript_106329:134-808(+)